MEKQNKSELIKSIRNLILYIVIVIMIVSFLFYKGLLIPENSQGFRLLVAGVIFLVIGFGYFISKVDIN